MAPSFKFSLPPKPELDMRHGGRLLDEPVGDESWIDLKHHQHRPTTSPRLSPPSSFPDMPLSRQSWLPRRPSVSSASNATTASNSTPITTHAQGPRVKDTDRPFGYADSNSLALGCRYVNNADNLGSRSSDSSPSITTYESSHSAPLQSHSQQCSSSLPSRHRMSLLSAASDALSFRKKMGSVSRKKPNFQSVPHTNNVMPGIIEINARNNETSMVGGAATHGDYEHEERERLRDMAAQSIGLDPELLQHPSKSASRSTLDSPQSLPQSARIPPFPATLAALHPFTEFSATLPKFVPSTSLLVYALAKQWKTRTLVLTSQSMNQKAHVHLFKGTSKDEKEIERLEVNEDSVIFVAEEEVGGRGHVVKLAGKDVSAKRNGTVGEESLRIMWFLQITDPVESQRWIATIKNAVLTQRAVRAGLDVPVRIDGSNGPKGDMDVMLSMRLQGIISTHPIKPPTTVSPPSPPVPTSRSPSPSLRSMGINTLSSPSHHAAVKGVSSGTRPRSPSVEGSSTLAYTPGHTEDSFGAVGTNLLTMLRTKSSADSSSSPSHSLPLPLPHVSRQGSPAPSLRSANAPVVITASDLKISRERDVPELPPTVPEVCPSTPPSLSTTPIPSLARQGTLTLSLQPPPRKSKHVVITPATSLHEQRGMYKQASGNRSVAGNFGIAFRSSGDVTPRGTSPVSLDSSSFSGGQPEPFSPNSSVEASSPCVGEEHGGKQGDEATPIPFGNRIINSSSSGDRIVLTDKLVQTTAVTKRWSRQGLPLPKQPSPPTGPPPSIPPSPEQNHRTSVELSISLPVTYAADRSPSSSSSNSHSQAQNSPRSGSSLSPTFWKRTSGSSTYSASSTNTSDSRGLSQRPMSSRGEPFPSLGSVVGSGVSSRPVSMSDVGSSSVAQIGGTKRRSMPPPRPAPNFAPPPAPTVQESAPSLAPLTLPTSTPQKSFRSSVARRALQLSLTSPKPPPSSALPPRPDEATFVQGHRRSSSTGSSDLHPISVSSSRPTSVLSGSFNPIQPTSHPPKSLSIKQRLRILSTPPISISPVQSSFSMSSVEVSTLDLSEDDEYSPMSYLESTQPFGLGEHIITMQNDPNFLQLETPVTPTIPKLPPRSPFRPTTPSSGPMSGLSILPFEPDRDFVALSPPPPRRGSRPHIVAVTRPEKLEVDRSEHAEQGERLVGLSQRGSMVSLGFVTAR